MITQTGQVLQVQNRNENGNCDLDFVLDLVQAVYWFQFTYILKQIHLNLIPPILETFEPKFEQLNISMTNLYIQFFFCKLTFLKFCLSIFIFGHTTSFKKEVETKICIQKQKIICLDLRTYKLCYQIFKYCVPFIMNQEESEKMWNTNYKIHNHIHYVIVIYVFCTLLFKF